MSTRAFTHGGRIMMPLPDPRVTFSSSEEWDAMVLLSHRNPGGRSDLEKQVQAAKTSSHPSIRAFRILAEPELCSFVKRPSDLWLSKQQVRPWRFTERRLAKVFLVSQDVPGFQGNWSEINSRKDELVEVYRTMGYEVEVYPLGSSESLFEMLVGRADHRLFFIHGEEFLGLRLTDRFVSWKEIEALIGPTGLAHFMSCWSHDAEIWEEAGEYSFRDALLDAGCSAVILGCNEGHHFDGNAKSGGNIEIQRVLGILDRCHELGLKDAMDAYRTGFEKMLGPIGASIFTDHEVAAGDPRWGLD